MREKEVTTFSSRDIIRSDKTTGIQELILPVQAYPRPEDNENHEEECIQPKLPAETATRERSPVGVKEETLNENDEILEGVKHEAEQWIQESKKMAEDILDAAREQAKHIMNTAVDDGYRSGYEEGLKAGVDKAIKGHGEAMAGQREMLRWDMKQALASVEEAKGQCFRTYLEELKDCSVAVAEEVIHTSLKPSGEVIKRMITSETGRLKKTAWVKIYMEKTEYEMMIRANAGIISKLSRLSDNIKFIAMDKEDGGNCIIEMSEEIVDISMSTQLENIREILQNIRV